MSEPFFSANTDELRDPLRPARGIANAFVLALALWGAIGAAWMVWR